MTDGLGVSALRDVMRRFRDAVNANSELLNRLNVYPVPDGDTGTNMARTLDAVVEALDRAPGDMASTCRSISESSLLGARGNSGVILSQILRGLAEVLTLADEAAPSAVADALSNAARAAYGAVSRPVEGTILTVAREVAGAAERAASRGASMVELLESAKEAGADALARTPDLLPVLRDAGVVDAGGAGFLYLVDAALTVLDGRPLPGPDLSSPPGPADVGVAVTGPRFEVMFLLGPGPEGPARLAELRSTWEGIGASIAIVGDDSLATCHIHTDAPGEAVEAALDAGGRPRRILITDLYEEAEAQHDRREREALGRSAAGAAGAPIPSIGVLAVGAGPGVVALLESLGATVVTGGQTMNPSTAELLAGVASLEAPLVVVLPGNRNIVAVAERLDSLSDKTVVVVPTRSIPESIAALVAFDPQLDPNEAVALIADAAARVRAGEVTFAVRDAPVPERVAASGSVLAGEAIALDAHGVVSCGPDLTAVVVALLAALVTDESEVVTVVVGDGATAEATGAARRWLAASAPHIEVVVIEGGQPVYAYLVGVE